MCIRDSFLSHAAILDFYLASELNHFVGVVQLWKIIVFIHDSPLHDAVAAN